MPLNDQMFIKKAIICFTNQDPDEEAGETASYYDQDE